MQTVRVLTLSGTNITAAEPIVVGCNNLINYDYTCSLYKINSTQFLLAWSSKIVVLTVNVTTVNAGTIWDTGASVYVYGPPIMNYLLGINKYVIEYSACWGNTVNGVYITECTINGTTIDNIRSLVCGGDYRACSNLVKINKNVYSFYCIGMAPNFNGMYVFNLTFNGILEMSVSSPTIYYNNTGIS